MLFDLDKIDTKTLSERGATMTVKSLDGRPLLNSKGKTLEIIVKGADSEEYIRLSRAHVRKRMARVGQEVTDAQNTEDQNDLIDLLVECTIGWNNFERKPEATKDGHEEGSIVVTFSKKACKQLYEQFPAIRDQVDVFIANRANFILASSKS